MRRSAFARLLGIASRNFLALALVLAPLSGMAQTAPLNAGPFSPGHVPIYGGVGSGQPLIQDSGPASGAGGPGIREMFLSKRGTGSPPYATGGSGAFGTNFCDTDGPVTGPYHFLCMDPNAGGSGTLAYGAAGGAPTLPFNLNLNGRTFDLSGTVTGPGSSTPGNAPVFGDSSGKTLVDGGPAANQATVANLVLQRVRLTDYILPGDPACATNCTGALTRAINAANAAGGAEMISLPAGIVTFGSTPAITANHVYFRGAAQGATRLITTTIYGITWSTATAPTLGGGMSDVIVDVNGTTDYSGAFFTIPYGSFMVFHDIFVSGNIGTLARLGASPTVGVNTIEFDGIRGQFANVPAPLFDLVSGSGFMLSRLIGFTNSTPTTTYAGRDIIRMQNYSWDTLIVHDLETVLFDHLFNAQANPGIVLQNLYFFNNVVDSSLDGIRMVDNGQINSFQFQDSWLTPYNGPDISLTGTGYAFGTKITNNKFAKSGSNGLDIEVSSFKVADISGNMGYGLNANAQAGAAGILLTGGSGWQSVRVTDNQFGGNASALGLNGQVYYGLSVNGVIDRFTCTYNDMIGATANYSGLTLAHTNSLVSPNIGQ